MTWLDSGGQRSSVKVIAGCRSGKGVHVKAGASAPPFSSSFDHDQWAMTFSFELDILSAFASWTNMPDIQELLSSDTDRRTRWISCSLSLNYWSSWDGTWSRDVTCDVVGTTASPAAEPAVVHLPQSPRSPGNGWRCHGAGLEATTVAGNHASGKTGVWRREAAGATGSSQA